MANWTNFRLVVIGASADVLAFSKAARHSLEYFTPEMRVGEGGDLSSDRTRSRRRSNLSEKTYHFQVAHDDARAHFRRLSRRHKRCYFIVASADPCWPESGSHLIRDGRCRSFSMSEAAQKQFCDRVGFDPGADEFDFDLCWETESLIMDACVDVWRNDIKG